MMNNTILQLKLEEMDFNNFYTKFPPIKIHDHSYPYQQSDQVQSNLNWDDYIDVPIFFWYPPQKISYYDSLKKY